MGLEGQKSFEALRGAEFLKPFHGDTPLHNLGVIKKHGIETWAGHRGKCYPWLKEMAT